MFNKFVFDITPHNTIRLWAYFQEEDWKLIVKSNGKIAFDFISCWGGEDKRETGLVSWEFPISLANYFIERYSKDSRADTKVLEKFLKYKEEK